MFKYAEPYTKFHCIKSSYDIERTYKKHLKTKEKLKFWTRI